MTGKAADSMKIDEDMKMIEEISVEIRVLAKTLFDAARKEGQEIGSTVVFVARKDDMDKGMPSLLPGMQIFEKKKYSLLLLDVSPFFQGDVLKDFCSISIRQIIRRINAVYAALVSETWVAVVPKEGKKKWDGKPASQQPNRVEALSIMESTPYSSVYIQALITREKGQDNHFRKLGKWEEPFKDKFDKVEGRFANLFAIDLKGAKA